MFESENRSESALKARTMDERVELFNQLKAEFGNLESKAQVLTVLMSSSNLDGFLTLAFEFEDQKPHKLCGIRIRRAESAEAAAAIRRKQLSTARSR